MTVMTKKYTIFLMHIMGLCIKLNAFVEHMLYVWSFSQNKSLSIDINHDKYFLSLNKYTTVFAWGYGNLNKNKT